MSVAVSVVISTHSPNRTRLQRTLDGLRAQTLPTSCWQLVLVDNASPGPETCKAFDLSWHPAGRLVHEPRLGLSYGRVAGARATSAPLLVLVDDDNVLAPDYLETVVNLFEQNPQVGALGGRSIPEWEVKPEPWVHEFNGCLALRDQGEARIADRKTESGYPSCAPLGAGMAIRRQALEPWISTIESSDGSVPTGRRGKLLTSGEDNDIVLTVLAAGWAVGYFPQLSLTHLIPAGRITRQYLARLSHGISRSWVQVLDRHGICPWAPVPAWSVGLRKLRAWFRFHAWRDEASYVRWKAACGMFEGRALLSRG
jgi:glycosyltransferase involved in cell wall biosynthesis